MTLLLTMLCISAAGIRNVSDTFLAYRGSLFMPSDFSDREPGVTLIGHITTMHIFNPETFNISVVNLDEPFAMIADPSDPSIWAESVSELALRVIAALGVDDVDSTDPVACEQYIYKTYGGHHEKSEVDS